MAVAERLAPARERAVRFTAEEFMALAQHPPIAEWTGKVELADGRIIRLSPANVPHWRIQQKIAADLRSIYEPPGSDWVVGPEASVQLGARKVRQPDVAVFRRPDLSAMVFQAAWLFLAVEVSDSTLRFDLGPKLRDYALAGIGHYWVVDLNGRELHAMSNPVDGNYNQIALVPFGEPLAVPGTDATIVID